jgi:hypothetical protein
MNNKFKVAITAWKKIEIILLVMLIFGYTENAFAEDKKVDINALILETQKQSQTADKVSMIWWVPEEYWRASFEQSPNVNATQVEAFIKVLRPYIVIIALDGDMGSLGGITYKSKETVQSSIQIIDSEGNHYSPLPNEKIDADTNNFLSLMKPVFSNMLGAMGENMNFYLFPAKNEKGTNIIDVKKESKFSVLMDKAEYKWKLPLSSLLPPRLCPIDDEKLNGTWKYCPTHGVELNKKVCPVDKKRLNNTWKFCPTHGVELN